MTASDGGLRPLFRHHLSAIFWTTVETGLVTPGVPDSHGIVAGHPFWIEFKQTGGWTVPLDPEQVGWLQRYVRCGGCAYVAVRRRCPPGPRRPAADELWLAWGGRAGELRAGGLRSLLPEGANAHHLLGRWVGGPTAWGWAEAGRILSRGR